MKNKNILLVAFALFSISSIAAMLPLPDLSVFPRQEEPSPNPLDCDTKQLSKQINNLIKEGVGHGVAKEVLNATVLQVIQAALQNSGLEPAVLTDKIKQALIRKWADKTIQGLPHRIYYDGRKLTRKKSLNMAPNELDSFLDADNSPWSNLSLEEVIREIILVHSENHAHFTSSTHLN